MRRRSRTRSSRRGRFASPPRGASRGPKPSSRGAAGRAARRSSASKARAARRARTRASCFRTLAFDYFAALLGTPARVDGDLSLEGTFEQLGKGTPQLDISLRTSPGRLVSGDAADAAGGDAAEAVCARVRPCRWPRHDEGRSRRRLAAHAVRGARRARSERARRGRRGSAVRRSVRSTATCCSTSQRSTSSRISPRNCRTRRAR